MVEVVVLTRLVIRLTQGMLRNRFLASRRDSFSRLRVKTKQNKKPGIYIFERALRILIVALKPSPPPKGPVRAASSFLHNL